MKATDDQKQRIAKALKLLHTAQEQYDQARAATDEAVAILTGGPTKADALRRLQTAFSTHWQELYGSPYAFAFARDMAQFKRLLGVAEESEVRARMARFFAEPDAYTTTRRHEFTVFVSRFNALAQQRSLVSRPVGCRHDPQCADDAAHTARMLAEQRQGMFA